MQQRKITFSSPKASPGSTFWLLPSRGGAGLLRVLQLIALALLGASAGCHSKKEQAPPLQASAEKDALCRVGSVTVYQSDLDRELQDRHVRKDDNPGKKKVLDELVTRAQFAQAALDAKIDRDPAVRAEFARVLVARFREEKLAPQLKGMGAKIPQERLRELYQADITRFRAPEKRQVAVLWLNPGSDPERKKQYEEKLKTAREFLLSNAEIKDHPEKGFSVLSVDYSEHAATRYKGGVLGWLDQAGGMDAWSKAVAQIAFALKERGDVSEVTSRPEGVFLVRYVAYQPAVQRPFEEVSGELERAERQRLRGAAEAEFEASIKTAHPVEWLTK